MSGFGNVMKGGWHPKGKDGGKESWRGDFKGINQVAGWMGKGKKPGEGEASDHVSRPLATLKDPSQFGPPPKNVNYHGGAALPNEVTPHTGGLGAPLSQSQIQSANRTVQGPPPEEIEEKQERQGPPLPYRADRTGLQTNHFAPPPVHRDIASPPTTEDVQSAKPNPRLPPRLPSRQASTGVPSPTSPPPPSYDAVTQPAPPPPTTTNGGLHTSAMNRLGNTVPSLGIGKNTETNVANPWKSERSQNVSSPTTNTGSNTLSELQSRFSRMNSSSNTAPSLTSTPPLVTAPTSPQPTSTPPTWQQSQSALRTASNFNRDPSSVSAADAKSAATTAQSAGRSANAFREKHADSIAVAGQRANAFNQKYKVQSRFEKFLDKHAPLEEQQQQQEPQGQTSQPQIQPLPQQGYQQPPPLQAPSQQGYQQPPPLQTSSQQGYQQPPPLQQPHPSPPATSIPEVTASIARKPPPPPPPKKPAGMHGNTTAPAPPVPLGTKPSYS